MPQRTFLEKFLLPLGAVYSFHSVTYAVLHLYIHIYGNFHIEEYIVRKEKKISDTYLVMTSLMQDFDLHQQQCRPWCIHCVLLREILLLRVLRNDLLTDSLGSRDPTRGGIILGLARPLNKRCYTTFFDRTWQQYGKRLLPEVALSGQSTHTHKPHTPTHTRLEDFTYTSSEEFQERKPAHVHISTGNNIVYQRVWKLQQLVE